MLKRPFREHHLLQLLDDYDDQTLPLDLFIRNYFKDHKAIGSKDRGFIAETVYSLVRWKGLLDYQYREFFSWEKRYELLQKENFSEYIHDEKTPLHIRCSFPQSLFEIITETHGKEKAFELCLISNEPAPTTVRINRLKTTRDEILQNWKEQYSVSPCEKSEDGIIFHKKINFFELPEFKAGFFEVQDEGSQLLAQLMKVEPGQQIIDYCSGSGGKTLAFAPFMKNSGQIYLHDIRPKALLEAKKRLKRAGIQNAQFVQAEDPKLKKLKKSMHWVLVDAPCTGTGTLRRNPDMKWKFTEETLTRLVGQQRTIFEKALSFMRPDGRIIYATCSILKQENQEQIAHFMKTYNLQVEGDIFQVLPSKNGMDGFFGVVLTQKKS